jgi:thiopeptide-type bacteriocin biosynthesis protein
MSHSDAWCSVHVFRHTDQDSVLLGCVEPLATALKKEGILLQMFFLRHWRGGPHIRFRVRVSDPNSRDHVLDRVCRMVQEYLTLHPSEKSVSRGEYEVMEQRFSALESLAGDSIELQPNDSLVVEPYIPELGKYGGSRGVALAESFFDASAWCVLHVLHHSRGIATKKMGQAFIMLFVGMCAFGLVVEEFPQFSELYLRTWEHYVPNSERETWEILFNRNRERLEERVRSIVAGSATLSRVGQQWYAAMSSAASGLLSASDEIYDAVQMPHAEKETKRRYLLLNYLHTHNNRLGILTTEEALLAFLATRTLQSLRIT